MRVVRRLGGDNSEELLQEIETGLLTGTTPPDATAHIVAHRIETLRNIRIDDAAVPDEATRNDVQAFYERAVEALFQFAEDHRLKLELSRQVSAPPRGLSRGR